MGPLAGKYRRAVGLALLGVTCCCLLVNRLPGDPQSRRLPQTYADLMRGPLLLRQDDPVLVSILQDLLHEPSSDPYSLRRPEINDTSERGQLGTLLDIIGGKTGGSFLEAGAFDGETHSNTLFLERFMDWTGVLVEAGNWNYRQLLLKHRRSRTLNACLASTSYPQQLGFEEMPGSPLGYVDPSSKKKDLDRQLRPRQCFPLHSVLLAAGLKSLDLLSLDVEGLEYLVLNSVPWHEVDIKIVMVDYVQPDFRYENGSFDPMFEEPITKVMLANSYILARKLETDLIFVKNGSEYTTKAFT